MSVSQHCLERVPTAWIRNYVAAFETGRVQKHPQARFVNDRGECCLVAAMAGARSAAEFVASPQWAAFPGTVLEELSRHFESCRVTAQDVYEEALLALAVRRPVERMPAALIGAA
jgi:hypothetical protein